MKLFQSGDFTLSSGCKSDFKIECDSISEEEWSIIAKIIRRKFQFRAVTGVPTGGNVLADLLRKGAVPSHNHLIVDDVYTTGASMRAMKEKLIFNQYKPTVYIGVVLFSREPMNKADDWIHPVFKMWG